MITRLKGILLKKSEESLVLDVSGVCYEIEVPKTVARSLSQEPGAALELVTYYFMRIDGSRCLPMMIGFSDELERDFFLQFTGVSGIGPKAALRALDRPVPAIARAIENGDLQALTGLQGIGRQKAKQIIAHLQGKVGRFLLLKEDEPAAEAIEEQSGELRAEANTVLKRLGYTSREAEDMIKKVLARHPELKTVEELLNLIYYERL